GAVVGEEGFLAIACCSHNVPADAFADEVRRGLRDAARPARLLREAGAAPDHPTHPALPESAYLKCLVYALD
ncbi:MAG TPA: RlmI/RlmK family 23S rRNA methyltransferase, partial [Thermoanaerobaculia bacterium]|nr:RlmI/RlmK family 23S rRNA methyltransferase [Thermoanaerobaculia bacterium]